MILFHVVKQKCIQSKFKKRSQKVILFINNQTQIELETK